MTHKQQGMTLIELLVAVSILALIVSTAVPTMNTLLGRKNIHAVAKIFDQSVRLARAEAVRRTQTIEIIPNSVGNNWANGWRIQYVDPLSGQIEIIKQFDALRGNPIFDSDTFTDSKPMRILPNGQAEIIGNFSLYFNNCSSSKDKVMFQVMLSGLLNKNTIPCT